MFSWLGQSMRHDTVAWLVISSLVGGIIGSLVKFGFEDVLRPRVGAAREIRATTRKYSTPLIRSAESLERRINNFLRNLDQAWYSTSDYYRLSTLYTFANYLSWIQVIEESFGFLPYESSRSGRDFNRRVNGVFRALSSFSYFSWCADKAAVDASQVPRMVLTAVGELAENSEGTAPCRYSEFTAAYEDNDALRSALAPLDEFLLRVGGDDPLAHDRLVAAGANLRALIRFLDSRGRFVAPRGVSNLDLVRHPQVARQLAEEFQYLERRPARSSWKVLRVKAEEAT